MLPKPNCSSETNFRVGRVAELHRQSPFANGMIVTVILFLSVVGLTGAVPEFNSLAAKADEASPANTSISANAANDQTIRGKCLRAKDQSPVAGAFIVLYELRGVLEEVSKVAETKSDQQGNFEFKKLKPMSDHRFDRRQYAMIAFAERLPHSFVNPIFPSQGLDRPQNIWMNFGPVIVPGTVVDENGNPIVGAIVQMSSQINAEDVGATMAKTDQKGEFALQGASVHIGRDGELGSVYLRIRHPEYSDRIFECDLVNRPVITLKKADCTIRGRVVDAESSQPVPNAVVSAIPFESGDGVRAAHVKTDENGNYELKVPQGKYKVVLDDDMQLVAEAQVILCRAQKEPYELPPFEAQEGGWIVGRVVNTKTNKPVVYSVDARVANLRVSVGLFGPNRPRGNLIYTEYLAEVDNDGFFRMRAFPGENFPYVCNMRCSRNTFTTMEQPAVIVRAGQETRCDIAYTPESTPAEKKANAQQVLDALPSETDARVAGIIDEFRKLNHTVDECEVWCLLMRELVNIGEPAVPPLCAELEATSEQRMMRRIAFALRAIGDRRAVPALIRVLPKTLQPPMSDYGLIVENGELAAFMRKHQIRRGRDRGNYFSFGRPVREVTSALETLTGHKVADDFVSISKSKDRRALAKQEKLYYEAAEDWAAWYESNWESLGVGQEYSQVDLSPFVARDLSDYPKGLAITKNAEKTDGLIGMVLTPVGDADIGATFFFDLDAGQGKKWPHDELPAADSSEPVVSKAQEWAASHNVDLLCTPLKDDPKSYVLLGIDLQLWEIDPFDAKNIEQFLVQGELPKGEPLKQPYLLHFDPASKTSKPKIGSSFLYVTREHGLGIITVTDMVTKAEDITGRLGAPKGVGFHRGVRFNYHSIAR